MNVKLVLMLMAFVCLSLAALEVKAPYVNLQALGLALAALAFLLG